MADVRHPSAPETSVIVVAISSIAHIRRCLGAILSQRNRERCEVVVAADPRLGALAQLGIEFPDVTFLTDPDNATPLSLTAMALQRVRGERVVLTEDSCIADPDWLSELLSAAPGTPGAAGGAVEVVNDVSSSMWAFAFVDFFRYMQPLEAGPSPSLSVCNALYSLEHLNSIRDRWIDGFHETEVHDALEKRFGKLILIPTAVVRVSRNVTFKDAIYERYAFGRLFAATRVSTSSDSRRFTFALLSLGLPILLLARLTAKAVSDTRILGRFTRAFPAVFAFVLAWSWGEWLGYVTGSLPRSTAVAPEISPGIPS